MPLDLTARIEEPDAFYEALMSAHCGMSEVDSMKLNARLILILANQVGNMDLLCEALALAQKGGALVQGNEN